MYEDSISDGVIPNAISKRYLSNGELYPTCDNELKYFLNTEDGRNGRNEYGEGKTIKYIDNLCLVDEMFDKITKVNRWLFPEGDDMDHVQETCCEAHNPSPNVYKASPDNSVTNSSGDECNTSSSNTSLRESNDLTDLTEISIALSLIVKKRNKRNLFIRLCNFVSKRFKRN